jgi:NTP pyrophosphatase (non-canonical NTP hydrolase)
MSKLNLTELEALTIDWAIQKGIAKPDNAIKQALKMAEEAGEVCGAILKEDKEGIRGEIGDVLVTLAILSHQSGLSLSDCFNEAYNKISRRKGETQNGIFIKESDLKTKE